MAVNRKFLLISLLFLAVAALYPEIEAVRLAEDLGAMFLYEPASGTCIISRGLDEVRFMVGGSFMLFNSSDIIAGIMPVNYSGGNILVPDLTADAVREFFKSLKDPSVRKVGAIVIDAGHGGNDPGAVRTSIDGEKIDIVEKDITLKIGKALFAMLRRRYPGKQIVMTRSTDIDVSLEKRSHIANQIELPQNEAIIFVSVHVDGALSSKSKGFSVHYFPADNKRDFKSTIKVENEMTDILPILSDMAEQEVHVESVLLAKKIIEQLEQAVGDVSPSRGIREANFSVVRRSLMPAVLVETGFLSNLEEARRLLDDVYLQKLIEAIYNGIRLFVTDYEKSNGFTE
ncbi:MAG: N-acetylmuramoyl-L-alanine amidase [Spirochaetales bacterium]|nr:N-acetylmuramoyl-L-alanine amidase [Spirochaetales bacterium]